MSPALATLSVPRFNEEPFTIAIDGISQTDGSTTTVTGATGLLQFSFVQTA